MCGIFGGYWQVEPNNIDKLADRALESLRHRGPDDNGIELFRCNAASVLLGHTRLSIVDLSAAGHQPMVSDCGRYKIIFNGEIYNYKELRSELQALGCVFHTHTDTEVLLSAWMQWGKECLVKLEGMFAFVVYDKERNKLICVRDAFGIKPFFYSMQDGRFLFASELKALLVLQDEKPQLDLQRGYDYLVHGLYDNNDLTFLSNMKNLLPGHYLQIELNKGKLIGPESWWRPNIAQLNELTFDAAAEAVRDRFLHNVRMHLRSDVPVGVALSGGIDSSSITSAIRYIYPDMPINAFSYIAPGYDVSEEKWIDIMGRVSDAKLHKVSASSDDLIKDLDGLIQAQGEPFGSTSIYAQYRVFQLAKEHGITVMLDGQGADELFAGYIGYPGLRILSLLEGGNIIQALKFINLWSRWPNRSVKMALMYFAAAIVPRNLYSLARKFHGRDSSPAWLDMNFLMENSVQQTIPQMKLHNKFRKRRVVEFLSSAVQERGLTHLLRHEDRNSMRFSIESRVPFLTPDMANLALSLPENYLISDMGETKSVFRAAMRGIVPDEVLDRKDKIGFQTPEKNWLLESGPVVREWLKAGDKIPFLNNKVILNYFDAMVEGKIPFSWQLWRWINFIRWYELVIE